MLKYRQNSPTAFGNMPFLKAGVLLAILALLSCAERVALAPPRMQLVNPASFQKLPNVSAYSEAYKNYEKGDQRRARSEYQKVLKKNPGHYPSLLGIGYTYLAEGNLDFAERYARKALAVQEEYAQGHYALAHILETRQDYEGALVELTRVRDLRPDYPGVEQNRNILRLKLVEEHLTQARSLAASDPDAALMHFAKAHDMAPEVPQILLEMAGIQLNRGRCEEAIQYLREVLQEIPDDPEAKMKLADCLAEKREYEEALGLYQDLAASNPGSALDEKIKDLQKTIAFLKMPVEYQEISRAEQVNRAQLAALLVTELPFLQKYQLMNSEIMVDILNHWARSYMQKVVDLGIMEVYPNRTFEPRQPISRLELANAANRVLQILSTSEGKQIPQVAENIQIPDLSLTSVNYPVVFATISAGVLSLDADGRFHPGRPVSGAEVMSMVNRLKNLSE
jgi:tetratricopeptide (TPR) repeat protein